MKPFYKILFLFLGIPLIIVALTIIAFIILSKRFSTLSEIVFIEGILVIACSGLIGAGFAEAAYYRNPFYYISDSYRKTIYEERAKRRDEQFSFMVIGIVLGFIIMFLGYLIGRLD